MQNVAEFKPKSESINWSTLIFVIVFHLVAVTAFFTFSWSNLAAGLLLWWVAGSLGIGIGYHRLLTHRGFKAPKWLEYTLSVLGTLALQSGPLSWVTTHRIHHAFTDTDKDPHSPRNGAYWSHIGWIFRGTAQLQSWATMQRYCPDFANDRFHQFLNKYYYVSTIIVAGGLFAIGGWSMVVWAIFLRTVVGWHFTWLVNSATHLWGSRRFETRDDSRNNALVAAVTWGEGWHNNHHAHPRSAKHGLAWYEFDINWIEIRILEKLGLVSNVYAYSDRQFRDEPQSEAIELTPLRDAA
ncbi:MAG TPA: fatty acid desaturase [Pyrinomonadaceae bacterium]|nr:fatty acid desaturase [Chloracidobacterium sp.]HBE83133.1 acyl-CoA desaturase [Blastocatellia bacterium]HRJ89813.1 fatty acid desaturase [Pyrinomonadaceae bacterium]HRK51010.1 fatty acid desaturase [Pyrinomonadaceae bacterium]